MIENPFVRLLFKIAYHKGIVIILDAHTLLFSYRNKQRNKLYNIKRSMAVNHGIKSTLFKIKYNQTLGIVETSASIYSMFLLPPHSNVKKSNAK
jgi:hypothetical protein